MIGSLKLSLMVFASIAGFTASATTNISSNCEEFRLDRNGGPFTQIPVYHQALDTKIDPLICYAVVASQLIDAERFRQGDPLLTLTSPLSIALHYRLEETIRPSHARLFIDDNNPVLFMVGGGFPINALNAINGKRVCDQRTLEQDVKLTRNLAKALPVDRFLLNIRGAQKSRKDGESISRTISNLEQHCLKQSFTVNYALPKEIKPGPPYPYLPFDANLRVRMLNDTLIDLLDLKNPHPVGIGYNHAALRPVADSGFVGHASIIIGRRKNSKNGKCELLVRDSYGASCVDSKGKPRYRLPCENGSVWVETQDLLKETMSLTWIP